MRCPECRHLRHVGHQYTGRGVCDACVPCRDFRSRYLRIERWRRDADEMLAEMDAEWVMRTGYHFGPIG